MRCIGTLGRIRSRETAYQSQCHALPSGVPANRKGRFRPTLAHKPHGTNLLFTMQILFESMCACKGTMCPQSKANSNSIHNWMWDINNDPEDSIPLTLIAQHEV